MRFIAVFLMTLTATMVTAESDQLFDVTGLDRSDVLDVRADIDRVGRLQDAKIVVTIPAGGKGIKGTGVSVMFRGARWREVRFNGQTGWVNGKFLASAGPVRPGDNLGCFGTEPFWSLSARGRRAELKRADGNEPISLTVAAKYSGLNRSNIWSYRFESPDRRRQLTGLLVFTDACSDGMSDRTFAFDFYLIGLNPESGPAQGCCSFA